MRFIAPGPHYPDSDLPSFTVAYQPIVNLQYRSIAAYEALIRGTDGTPYPRLVAEMGAGTLRRFHQITSAEAIRCAVSLGLSYRKASLTINLQPDLHPLALNASFLRDVAHRCGLPTHRIVLELTEDHRLSPAQLSEILASNRAAGFASAMDDFGAGYSGLTALVSTQPEILKLDRALVTDIDTHATKQKIVRAFVKICNSLRIVLIAEGVETSEECRTLRQLGIKLIQGYFFSKPIVGSLRRFEDCIASQSNGTARRQRIREDSELFAGGRSAVAAPTPQARIA